MKRIVSLFLCLVLLAVSFCACGKKGDVKEEPFDEAKYSVSHAISGVSFLYPAEVNNHLLSWSAYQNAGEDLQAESYAEYSGSDMYALLKPGQMGIYCFSLGRRNHLEGRTDLKTLANWLGISYFISFAARGSEEWKTEHVEDQYTKNIFPAVMKDTEMNEKLYGYVVVLKDDSNNNFYVYAVGSVSDEAGDMAVAKEMAEYFCLNKNT